MRFVLRIERTGGFLFDRKAGKAVFIDEAELGDVETNFACGRVVSPSVPRPSLPEDCHAAPSKVFLELTAACNLDCPICYKSTSVTAAEELSGKQVFNLLEQFSAAGVFEVRLTGGEPTLRRDFFDIANYAHELGLYVSLGSNGVWSDKVSAEVARSPVASVTISVDGGREANDRIRGNGSFKHAVRALSCLSRDTDKKLVINFTAGRTNAQELRAVADLADSLGIPELRVTPVRPQGRAADFEDSELLRPADYMQLVKTIKHLRTCHQVVILTYFDILGRKPSPSRKTALVNGCPAGVASCAVSPAGDVYGCPLTNAGAMSEEGKRVFLAGNILTEPLMSIWLDSERWRAHRNREVSRSPGCLACQYYLSRCFGNCVVSSYLSAGKVSADDPFCFAGLLPAADTRVIMDGDEVHSSAPVKKQFDESDV